jgi:glycosyltransferase involved in cell wall biosynthesis
MLTVLMAAHNSAKTLPRVLDAYRLLQPPSGGWKAVIADNGSTDATAEIVRQYADQLPVELVLEPRVGQNRARNTGLLHVEGDLVVMTDDDTVPQADWLLQMRGAADLHPEFDVFGGKIVPLWPSPPPEWFFRLVPLGMTFAMTAPDLVDGPIAPGLVWSPNMAVRRKVFDAGHRFDESVGPQPGQYRMGSETEFTTRIERHGHRARHCAKSVVGHIIRPAQMDPNWIIRRGYRFGKDMYWKERAASGNSEIPQFWGIPRWKLRKLVQEAAKSLFARLTSDFESGFAARWETQYLLGYCWEALQARRMERRRPT